MGVREPRCEVFRLHASEVIRPVLRSRLRAVMLPPNGVLASAQHTGAVNEVLRSNNKERKGELS